MALLVAAQLWIAASNTHACEWFAKPAAAVVFIAAGYGAGALQSTWGTVLFAGLVLCAVGDVLLIPKDERAFLGGLASFLLGHVAYAAAFVIRGVDWRWAGVAALAMIAVAIPVLRWIWPHVDRPMRGPVAAYILVITAMVALAVGTLSPWLVVGAVGFYLSDLSVAKGRFIGQSFGNRAWGLPLYFFSQLVLATAVAP
jgi:uncharacterized membrane protein YhhN